ncbi:MAG: hypothetical protein ABL982_21190, partial [Vicinamibacterales bacterium]
MRSPNQTDGLDLSDSGSTPCACGCARCGTGATTTVRSAGRLFDAVVYRGADPNAWLDPTADGGRWQIVGRPGSIAGPFTPRRTLVIERALGEGFLATASRFEDLADASRLVDADGRLRPDVLVLEHHGEAFAPPASDARADDVSELNPLLLPSAAFAVPAAAFGSGGRAVMARVAGETHPADSNAREAALVAAITSGNIPTWLRRWVPIRVELTTKSETISGIVKVLPDYLCVGTDSDYLHAPLDPVSAQQVADHFGVLLPTARICHAVYLQTPTAQQIDAITRDYSAHDSARRTARRGRDATSTAAYVEHSEAIQARMRDRGVTPGTLVAGHKKDVVISPRLTQDPNRV